MVWEYGDMVFAASYIQREMTSPKHFHYVAPSFWAWKGGDARIKRLSEFVDHVLCILPFEAEVCKLNGLAATFVGHPTLEDILEFKVTPFHLCLGSYILFWQPASLEPTTWGLYSLPLCHFSCPSHPLIGSYI